MRWMRCKKHCFAITSSVTEVTASPRGEAERKAVLHSALITLHFSTNPPYCTQRTMGVLQTKDTHSSVQRVVDKLLSHFLCNFPSLKNLSAKSVSAWVRSLCASPATTPNLCAQYALTLPIDSWYNYSAEEIYLL